MLSDIILRREAVKLAPVNKHLICDEIRAYAKHQGLGPMPKVISGIADDNCKNAIKAGEDFIYIDHAYFDRGWAKGMFRAVRSKPHLTYQLDRPTDRLNMFGVKVEPWRKRGREIVIIPPSLAQAQLYDAQDWVMKTESRLKEITDRPLAIKVKKMVSLKDFCIDTWAIVTYASVAGVEAALMGIPVFSTENCPSWPVNSGPLESIETPTYPENRVEWASSLAYASWNTSEFRSIRWFDYDYCKR